MIFSTKSVFLVLMSLSFSIFADVETNQRFHKNHFALSVLRLQNRDLPLTSFTTWQFAWTPIFRMTSKIVLVPQVGLAFGKEKPTTNYLMFELTDGLRIQLIDSLSVQVFGGFQSWMNEKGTFGLYGAGVNWKFPSPLWKAFDELSFAYTRLKLDRPQNQYKLGLRFGF